FYLLKQCPKPAVNTTALFLAKSASVGWQLPGRIWMKFQTLTALAFLGAGCAAPAVAQTVVTHGVGLAHDCYIYARMGRAPRDGIDACNQALEQEALDRNDKAATYDNRGVMLDAIGKLVEAEEDFQAALRLKPDLGDAHVNLGSMLIKKRQYPEALAEIN